MRLIREAPVIAYPANPEGHSQARAIAAAWLSGRQREVAIRMPFHADRGPANRAYDEAASRLSEALAAGEDVAVLCEGDPLLYGSFLHLHARLAGRFPCAIVPGVSAIGAAAAASGRPLAIGDERIAIVPATAGDEALRQALTGYDCVAILKPGRRRPRILELLAETGRSEDAVYVEQASREAQRIVARVADIPATPGPYFALFLVTRRHGP